MEDIDSAKQTQAVDMWLSIMKPLGAKWLVGLFNYIKVCPDIISNDFVKVKSVTLPIFYDVYR